MDRLKTTLWGRMGCIPSRSDQVFCLDLAGAHLPVLCALFYILDELLFLVFELYPLTVELSLCLFQCSLMFS